MGIHHVKASCRRPVGRRGRGALVSWPWRAALSIFAFVGVSLVAASASAYPWMIRHNYAGCNGCHWDPSGGGVLTKYGRDQGDLLLTTQYFPPASDDEPAEPSSAAGFLWGAFPVPDWLGLGGSFRAMTVAVKPQGSPADVRFVAMQADLRAGLDFDVFRAAGSLGYAHEGALPASITQRDADNLVSREHWLGVALDDEAYWLRAGRMNLPFGIRNIDHTLWVRTSTRTDIDSSQQYGVAFAYTSGDVRSELMGIVGNFQLNPDAFRERGYAGFLEWSPTTGYAVGVSSLLTSALIDTRSSTTLLRQAHGAFARASPWTPLVLLAEVDALVDSPAGESTAAGVSGMLQADVEPVQGLHVAATGELLQQAQPGAKPSVGGWLGLTWFFLPHADVRVDGVVQSVATSADTTRVLSLIGQLHVYL